MEPINTVNGPSIHDPDPIINIYDPRIVAIYERLQDFFDTTRDMDHGQAMCVAEEAGEFLKQARRYLGLARTQPTLATFGLMAEELADVVITCCVAAQVFGIDLSRHIEDKLSVIETRGGI